MGVRADGCAQAPQSMALPSPPSRLTDACDVKAEPSTPGRASGHSRPRLQEAITHQTLISSMLHNDVSGTLQDVDARRAVFLRENHIANSDGSQSGYVPSFCQLLDLACSSKGTGSVLINAVVQNRSDVA